jgi:hypothetical protein
MFGRMIDDIKASTGNTLRLTSLAGAVALALFITLSFLCAAAFIYMFQQYGPIEACLTGAGIFLVVAIIAGICYSMRKERVEAHAAEPAKSAMQSALADPMLVAAGLQVIRTIGIKKLIPILAVGGLALGFLASRNGVSDQTPAE